MESYKLKILKCAGCHINDDVCGCIASGIQYNCELVCLDLSCNGITTVGVKKLMVSLQQNSSLEELNLSGNALFAISDDISQTRLGQAVSKMLEYNHTLVNFNLDCDNLDIAALKEISKGLNSNPALKILSVKCNASELSSLIPTLSTMLSQTCFNFSDTCSLLSSNVGWTIKVKSNTLLTQIFTTLSLSKININKVVISIAPVPESNFSECCLSCSQLQSLLRSLEDNCVVKKLSLNISNNLTHTECEDLRHSLESALKENCILTHLVLLGAVNDEIVQGLEASGSIRQLCVQVTGLKSDTIVKFVQSLEISNILSVTLYPLIELDSS